MNFLTARWSHLVLLTYQVPPDLIRSIAPPKCEPEIREGKALASFVAFHFQHCRVLGVKWPGYTNFPEINLRYYATHNGERGVAFGREFVPQRLIAAIPR